MKQQVVTWKISAAACSAPSDPAPFVQRGHPLRGSIVVLQSVRPQITDLKFGKAAAEIMKRHPNNRSYWYASASTLRQEVLASTSRMSTRCNVNLVQSKLYCTVFTFFSPSCLGQETAKGPFGLRVQPPPADLRHKGEGRKGADIRAQGQTDAET